jgi:hypothetical protein
MDRISMGDWGDESTVEKPAKDSDTEGATSRTPVDVGQEPPLIEFAMDMPNMSSIDLCVDI